MKTCFPKPCDFLAVGEDIYTVTPSNKRGWFGRLVCHGIPMDVVEKHERIDCTGGCGRRMSFWRETYRACRACNRRKDIRSWIDDI